MAMPAVFPERGAPPAGDGRFAGLDTALRQARQLLRIAFRRRRFLTHFLPQILRQRFQAL
ncbi:hypothetical protein M8494_14435 [Serratia ureilytica]